MWRRLDELVREERWKVGMKVGREIKGGVREWFEAKQVKEEEWMC